MPAIASLFPWQEGAPKHTQAWQDPRLRGIQEIPEATESNCSVTYLLHNLFNHSRPSPSSLSLFLSIYLSASLSHSPSVPPMSEFDTSSGGNLSDRQGIWTEVWDCVCQCRQVQITLSTGRSSIFKIKKKQKIYHLLSVSLSLSGAFQLHPGRRSHLSSTSARCRGWRCRTQMRLGDHDSTDSTEYKVRSCTSTTFLGAEEVFPGWVVLLNESSNSWQLPVQSSPMTENAEHSGAWGMQAQESPAPSLRAPRFPPDLSVFVDGQEWCCWGLALSRLASPVKNVKNSSLPCSGLCGPDDESKRECPK